MRKAQSEILKAIATERPLADVLELIVRANEELIPEERCVICLIDTDRMTLLNGASPSLAPELSAALHHVRLADDSGAAGPVDPVEHPAWKPYSGLIEAHGSRLARSEPIVTAGGEVVGYAFGLRNGGPVSLTHEQRHWVTLLADMTLVALRHAQVEESLRLSEGRLQALIDHSPAVIVMKDAEGRYLLANRAWQELFDVSEQDVIGRDSRAVFGDEVGDVLAAPHREVLERLAPMQREIEVAGRHLQVVYFPIRTPRGTPYAVGAIGVDVTENKKNQERLAQAAKMELASQLASGVAHDFNNILTGIAMSASAIDEPNVSLDDLRGSLEDVKSLVSRAAVLTRRLLTFSSPRSSLPDELDLTDVMGELAPLLEAAAQGKAPVELDVAADLPHVNVDRPDLERAVVNLVLNARDAVGEDGHITVTCRVSDTDASEVILSVTDDGCGMDAATVARVFEPFFTTKDGAEGTGFGLGLAVVQGVAHDAGGRVEIESEVGRGTAVHLYLPVAGGRPR